MQRRDFFKALFGALAAAPFAPVAAKATKGIPPVAPVLPEFPISKWVRIFLAVDEKEARFRIGPDGGLKAWEIRTALPKGYKSKPFYLGATARFEHAQTFEEAARSFLQTFRVIDAGKGYTIQITPPQGYDGDGIAVDDILMTTDERKGISKIEMVGHVDGPLEPNGRDIGIAWPEQTNKVFEL